MNINTKAVFSVVGCALFFAAAASAHTKDPVIRAYFKVEQAVVNEDLNAAKVTASDLAQKAQAASNEAILKDASDLAKTESIDRARQVFKGLSEDALNLIESGEGSQGTTCSLGNAKVKPWLPKILDTGYQSTACSIGDAPCMRPQKK